MVHSMRISLPSIVLTVLLASSVVAGSQVGDLNRNCRVDFVDLRVLAEQWLSAAGGSADLNGDDKVNTVDFALLAENWSKTEAPLVISEFMASNTSNRPPLPPREGDLLDEDGDSSDWVEIYNPTDKAINLDGWSLTDNKANLTKWRFPAVELAPGEFLLVFSSGKDRCDAVSELHTNFQLDAGNPEYLALVGADGATIAHEYEPTYPQQLTNISYGVAQYSRTLVSSGATASYHVPSSDDAGADWASLDFDDSGWETAATGLGFGFGGTPITAYNDCVYRADQYKAENVTTYGIGAGYDGPLTGPLVDYATGDDMGITVTLSEAGGVNWQPDPGGGGSDCREGTDAYSTFGDIADMTGVIYYGSAGWWIDVTFTGLEAATEYTFATSSARCSYGDRLTIYTISGADTYVNASTDGVDVLAEDKVRFNTGDNYNEGYVARWTGIRSSGGSFTVRAEADASSPEGRRAYSFDVFMLQGGFGGSDVQEQMQNVNASLWSRIEFFLEEGEAEIFDTLTLRMKYEDGFVAYLNGQEVASRNAPASPQWNSTAKSDRPIEDAAAFESINILGFKGVLRTGRNVLAIHGLNDDKGDGEFLILPELIAASSAGVPQYFTKPTPGKFNVSGAKGIVDRVWFSHERGFYSSPFELTLSTETEASEIRYTLDGSEPTITHGSTYTDPVPIYQTTTIRAVAVKPGFLDSRVETHTYIFLNDVVKQSPYGGAPGPGWPTGSVNGQRFEYGMDPAIVDHATWGPQLKAALTSIPTMSIVTDLDNLFDRSNGIYVNAGQHGRAWERPTSLELLYPGNPDGPGFPDLVKVSDGAGGVRWALPDDMQDGFQINAGLRIRGGYSRSGDNPKHAFRLFFRAEYGDAKLDYPLFGDEGVDGFDKVDLRTAQNYSWSYGNDGANTMCRDVWARDTQGQIGQAYTRSRYYHLYINGHYWGIFQTQERPEAAYGASYFGGGREEWDCVKATGPNAGYTIEATDGTLDDWRELWDTANLGFGSTANYYRAQGLNPDGSRNPSYPVLLDVDNLIDYMMMVFYDGDRDAPISNFLGNTRTNNWYGIRNRNGQEGFRYFVHDAEHIMSRGMSDRTGPYPCGDQFQYSNPQWIHQELMAHADYLMRFADRAHKYLHNDGPLTAVAATERFRGRAQQIDMAIIAESARWGSSSLNKNTWLSAINNEINYFFPNRAQNLVNQFRNTRLRSGALARLYPSIDAPVFGHPGGLVPSGFDLYIVAWSDAVYYTLDGSDPRVPAALSSSGVAVTLLPENSGKRVFVPTGGIAASRGTILAEYWFGIDGTAVSDLTSSANYPHSPSKTEQLTLFEMPADWNDNYGTRVRGYIHPPTTGDYTFWIASDDASELWLSTDANPNNAVLIAGVPGWTSSRQWTKYAEQRSAPISVTAGQKYYIEALQKEGSGGDNLAVAWQGPGISQRVIEGKHLSPAGIAWVTLDFQDTAWTVGIGGVGYERETGYEEFIGADVESKMYNINSTCYIRIPFIVMNTGLTDLTLNMRYDDGLIAYINGTEILRVNFDAGAVPEWDCAASASHDDSAAVVFESFDISNSISLLRSGYNLLAIHGLNTSKTDSDFLISAELVAHAASSGDIAPTATIYTGPITLDETTQVKARVFDGAWSAVTEGTFAVDDITDRLRITEIMCHPLDTGDPNDPNEEFVELKNVGTTTVDLNLVQFTKGIHFTFPKITLSADEYIVVVKDRSAFEASYGTGINIAGEYSGSLANDGERVRLEDAIGQKILDFRYRDGWYDVTDEDGFSLTIIDPTNPDPNSWGLKDSWRPSAGSGGSPGWDDTGFIPNPGSVVINEVLAHSHAAVPDWIELHNTTDQPINIGGWFLSDSDDDDPSRMKYRIAPGTTIAPNGYVVFYEDEHFGNVDDPGCIVSFALSETGEEVVLSSAEGDVLTGYRDVEDFGASDTGVAFGRYRKSTDTYNFVPMSENTPGWANAYPKVGPIVINEIMYNPQSGNQNEEYIELLNISDYEVALYDAVTGEPWKFTDGIELTFPTSPIVTVPAGKYVLVVKDLAAFTSRYGSVPSDVQVFEYDDGKLDNGGEKLEIGTPGDVDGQGVRQYIRIDRVNYSDGSHPVGEDPWPTQADGQGKSLSRIDPQLYGNDVINWQAADPSPGTSNP